MRYAHVGNSREEPRPGLKGNCQVCKSPMIAACGEIVKWHWKHKNLEDCDPWYGEMTQWHIDWQNHFPKINQEVVINQQGVKHIADVLTDKNLVIEFQHSPISSKEIREREEFYGNMIWVVDAKDFKKNMIRSDSVEYQEHIRLDRLNEHYERSLKAEMDDDTKKVEKEIEKLVGARDGKGYSINRIQKEIEEDNSLKINIETFVEEKLILPWVEDGTAYAAGFGVEFDSNYKELKRKAIEAIKACNSNRDEIEKVDEQQEKIVALESIEIEGVTYKKVSYGSVKQARLDTSCAISKASLKTMFREVVHFKSNQEVLHYEYKQDEYLFAVNPQTYLDSIITDRDKNQKDLVNLVTIQEKTRKEVLEVLNILIVDKDIALIEKQQSIKSDRQNISKKIRSKRQRLSRLKRRKSAELKKIDDEHRNSIEDASEKHANEYYYKWNHERRSWRYTKRPVFMDFGKRLLKRVSQNSFREINKLDFIAQIKSKDDCQSIN